MLPALSRSANRDVGRRVFPKSPTFNTKHTYCTLDPNPNVIPPTTLTTVSNDNKFEVPEVKQNRW